MFEKDSGLSRYVKWIMNCRYPASSLLNPSDFIKHVGQRGLSVTQDNLEFYDKIGILRPMLRLKTPTLDENSPYQGLSYSDANIFQLQHYYSIGWIELPRDGDFQDWSDYKQKDRERCLYYHPYQLLQLDQIRTYVNLAINSWNFGNDSESFDIRSRIHETLERKKHLIMEWIDRIGLLILLDEFYRPLAMPVSIPHNLFDSTSPRERQEKKIEWAKKFSPNHILLLSGMKIEEIENFYKGLSYLAKNIDPIHKWFMLQQIIKNSRRYELSNDALLAQEYYGYLFMLGSFVYDVTGRKILDPDDILDSQQGKWKERIFGQPVDYTSKKTQNQILNYFLWDRPFELVFVVEGQTEEKVIELILEARSVDLEKDGFFVYNIEGINNLLHLKPLFRVSQLIDILIFAMVDNDKEVDKTILEMKESAKKLGYTKEMVIRKWDRDFESENFGIDKVIEKINQILDEKGFNRVKKEDVQTRMANSGDALIKTIENEIRKINYHKFESGEKVYDIISKPRLAALLIEDRLKEIQIIDDPHWNAVLPIEIELKNAFRLIPSHI